MLGEAAAPAVNDAAALYRHAARDPQLVNAWLDVFSRTRRPTGFLTPARVARLVGGRR